MKMINYVTKYEYSGRNAVILASVDADAVVTFKQAVRQMKVPGKKLKGIKSVATLVRFSKTEKEADSETGQMKPKPIYFSVFDANEVLKRSAA
jgi:ribosomal protein L14E/L6E/L27E